MPLFAPDRTYAYPRRRPWVFTLPPAAGGAADVAEVVFYNEDSASPLSVTKPASFATGQILILIIVNDSGALTDLTAPAGWTTVPADVDITGQRGKAWYHVFDGGEPASWDFGYNSGAAVAAALVRITGADTTPTLVAATGSSASNGASMDSPTVTPSGTNDLLLVAMSNSGGSAAFTATDPSGTIDQGQTQVSDLFEGLMVAKEQLASGSATGVRTWTSVSPTARQAGTWSIAVKSAAAGAATVTPAAIAVTTTLPRPNVNVTAGPTAVAATTALTQPAVNVVAGPVVTAATVALAQPAVNVVAGPVAIPVVVALPQAVPLAGGNVTATPAVLAALAALPQSAINVVTGPAVLAAVAALTQPAVNVAAGPVVLAAVTALARPNVNVTAAPVVTPAVTALAQPAVNIVAGPAVLAAVVALPTPTVLGGGGDATATPGAILAVVALPSALLNVTANPAVIPIVVLFPLAGGAPVPALLLFAFSPTVTHRASSSGPGLYASEV